MTEQRLNETVQSVVNAMKIRRCTHKKNIDKYKLYARKNKKRYYRNFYI